MQLSSSFVRECKRLLGSDAVHTDKASLALNGYDCSASQHRPDAVLTITQPSQLQPLLALLAQHKIPFTLRAAATNHAGSCSALRGGVVLNLNPLHTLYRIDTAQGIAEADPGLVTADLQRALRPLGLFYAPDPASEQVSTLGGNLAQNASGARCLKYGNTARNTLQISFLTPQGQSFVLRHDNPGPDFLGLIAGSEGTLGIVQNIQVKVQPIPPQIHTFLVAFDSIEQSVQAVTDLVAKGLIPRCVEAMDRLTTQTIESFAHAGYPDAEAVLIIELDADAAQIQSDVRTLQTICRKNKCLTFTQARSPQEREKIWQGRRAAYAAMAALAPNVAVGDGTVPRSQLPAALKKVRQIIDRYGVTASLLFHAGDGNFHPQIVFNATNPEQTRLVQKALQEILKTCVDHGGTISGEHGIGVEKRAVMTYQYSKQTLGLFQKIKDAFDPLHLANPGKIIPVDFQQRAADAQAKQPAARQLAAEIKKRFDSHARSRITGAAVANKQNSVLLSTAGLNKILDIDTTNYTATVQAGVRVPDLLKALRAQKVYASLPPDYTGTIGTLVATKYSAQFCGELTGLEAILPNAEVVQYGGKVMKNAAGYNLCSLFSGSWGALGVITEITFRIYARPQMDKTAQVLTQVPCAGELFTAIKNAVDPQHLFICAAFEKEEQ